MPAHVTALAEAVAIGVQYADLDAHARTSAPQCTAEL